MLKIKDLNLTIERPRANGSKLTDRIYASEIEKQNKVEECVYYTYYTAMVSTCSGLCKTCGLSKYNVPWLQHLSLINVANEVVKSEYYVTDGVDSLNFASVNGKQDARVKMKIKGRDIARSEQEYNSKVQGSA